MEVISVMNVKGGVGKTITAVNMSEILAGDYNKRVLLIDADPQADATDMLINTEGCAGLYELITFGGGCKEYVKPTRYRNLDMICASSDLFYISIDAANVTAKNMSGLMDAIRLDDSYDVVVIDCPPSFTATSVAAICNSDHVVIPVKLDAFGIRGANFLAAQIEAMHDYNPNCQVAGALVTMWHNSPVCLQSLDPLSEVMDGAVFETKIRRTDKADESTFYGQALSEYSRFSSAGRDYRKFVAELVAKIFGEEVQ